MALPAAANTTKSKSTTESVRGEHRFEITDYSHKLRAGRRVLTSDTFTVGGLDWAIIYHLFDDGEVLLEDHVSVFVRLVTPNATAWALYDLRLVDPATGLPHSVRRSSSRKPVAFDARKTKKRERGSRRFMPRLKLQDSYLRDDRLTVECVLDVVQDTFVSETVPSPTTAAAGGPPVTDLSTHLGALLLRKPVMGADVTFVYTDALPDDLLLGGDLGSEEHREVVCGLLAGAERYGMGRLKKICELVLSVREPTDSKRLIQVGGTAIA